jgi:hypothetical protein
MSSVRDQNYEDSSGCETQTSSLSLKDSKCMKTEYK